MTGALMVGAALCCNVPGMVESAPSTFVVTLLPSEEARQRQIPGAGMILSPDGTLSDDHGREVKDSQLKSLLTVKYVNSKDGSALLLVWMIRPKDVSVATLGRVMKRLRKLADPKRATRVYVLDD